MRTRAIVASVLVSIAALIGIGAGGRSDPPARAAKRAVRGPIIAVSPMADYDGIAAADHEIETYLAWQHEQDLIAAYLDARFSTAEEFRRRVAKLADMDAGR